MNLILMTTLVLFSQGVADDIFLKQPIDREVIAGRTTDSFDCVLKASVVPDISVRWIHTDLQGIEREYPMESIIQNNERYQLTGEPSKGEFSILLLNATKLDAGAYRCRVRHKDGVVDVSQEGTLTILNQPANGYPKCKYSDLPNGKTELNCMVDSNASTVNIKWTKLGEDTPIGQVVNSRVLSTSLLINDNDNGVEFRCKITGNSVDKERFCDITPMNQPPIAEFRSEFTETSTSIGGHVLLKCDSFGKPYISKVRWFYGDRYIERTSGRFRISMDKTILEISEMTENDHDQSVTCEASVPSGLATNVTRNLNIYKLVTFPPPTLSSQSTLKLSRENSLLIIVISGVAAICVLLIIIICMCYDKLHRLSQVKSSYPMNNGLILRMPNDSPRDSLTHSFYRDSIVNDSSTIDEVGIAKTSTLPNHASGFQTIVCFQPGPDSPAICYPVSTPISGKSVNSASPFFKNAKKNKKSASFSNGKRRDSKCTPQDNSTAQFSSMHSLCNIYDTISSSKKPRERTGSL